MAMAHKVCKKKKKEAGMRAIFTQVEASQLVHVDFDYTLPKP